MMIWVNNDLKDILFKEFNFMQYVKSNNIAGLVGIDLAAYGDPNRKKIRDPSYNSDNLEHSTQK